MDNITQSYFEDLQLKEGLTDPDNHTRSRAAQFLSSLAISDP